MFTPAMGFYSQTCKRAKGLAFHSRPGTLEMNLFLYLFTFCSRKRALLCTNTSAWAFRNGLSLIFGESTGSMLFNSTIQSQIENIVRKKLLRKKLKLHFGKYSHTIADKKKLHFGNINYAALRQIC